MPEHAGPQILAAKSHEIDVRPVEHQLDAHQHAQRVALGGHADHAGDEHDRPDDQVVRNADGLRSARFNGAATTRWSIRPFLGR